VAPLRAVRFLVAEAGIRQFVDIGSGLPTANNVHEVARSVVPETRVVCVDNDPCHRSHAVIRNACTTLGN
jgi:S-adenosyl methyltransferase